MCVVGVVERRGLGGGVECDGVAEPFELPHQPAGVGFGVTFVAEPVRSEALVRLVAQQHVVAADQHRARYRDCRPGPCAIVPQDCGRRDPRQYALGLGRFPL